MSGLGKKKTFQAGRLCVRTSQPDHQGQGTAPSPGFYINCMRTGRDSPLKLEHGTRCGGEGEADMESRREKG